MAQSTILASAQTAGTSTEIVVAAGAEAIVGIFTASGSIPRGVSLALHIKTPGRNGFIQNLTAEQHHVLVPGPASYYVNRPDISAHGVNVGVYLNT